MHYNGPIVRPPTDADSVFIEVTVGCTHNSCTFCNFYQGYPFRIAPMAQIEEDLQEASRRWPHATKVWASGGNPYALRTERLVEIGNLIRRYFPEARISTYARVDDLTRKTVDEMRRIKEAGIVDLVVGVESGDDDVLRATNKGYSSADILEGCSRLEEAGVSWRIIYLGGLAGRGMAVESARRSAELFNRLHPYMMYLTTVAVLPGTQLFTDVSEGRFIEVDERERLEEFRTLLSNLENEIIVYSLTSTVSTPFVARLPEQKEEIVSALADAESRLTDREIERIDARRHQMTTV